MIDRTKPYVTYYCVGGYDGETEYHYMFSFFRREHQPGQSQLVKASELSGFLGYLEGHDHYQIEKLS